MLLTMMMMMMILLLLLLLLLLRLLLLFMLLLLLLLLLLFLLFLLLLLLLLLLWLPDVERDDLHKRENVKWKEKVLTKNMAEYFDLRLRVLVAGKYLGHIRQVEA